MIILCGNVLLLRYMSLDMLFRVSVCVQAHPPRDKNKMHCLTAELSDLFVQSHQLEEEIRKQLKSIGYEIK